MMAKVTYQVTLASDGKPTVSVTSDDPQARARPSLGWPRRTRPYSRMPGRSPGRRRPWSNSRRRRRRPCAVHQVPMRPDE